MPDQKFFDDMQPGTTEEFGSTLVEEAEIVEFARRYDPQPFHLDREAAKGSIFGGLAASGWHTASLMMRMLVDHATTFGASMGSPGVDELRWLRPVRPGDVLSLRVTVLDVTPSRSKPDRGLVRSNVEVMNQDRDLVMTVKTMVFLRRRPATPSP